MQGIYLFIPFAMKSMLGDDFAGNKALLKSCRVLMQGLRLIFFFEKNFNFQMSKTFIFALILVSKSWIHEGYLPVAKMAAICSHHENIALSLLPMCALSSHWTCIHSRNLERDL